SRERWSSAAASIFIPPAGSKRAVSVSSGCEALSADAAKNTTTIAMKVLAKARMDAQTYHLRHKAQVNASMTTRKEVLRARPFAASIAGACVRRGTLLFSRQGVVMTRAIWVIFLLSLSTSLTAAV